MGNTCETTAPRDDNAAQRLVFSPHQASQAPADLTKAFEVGWHRYNSHKTTHPERRLARAVGLCGLCLLILVSRADAQTPQQIVDSFYPPTLAPGTPGDRHSCYAVLAATSNGTPLTFLAGYTDRTNAAVRVLRRPTANASVQVVFDGLPVWDLIGSACEVEATDVDGDGIPEGFVTLSGMRGSVSWIFKWSPETSTLTNLTPTRMDGGYEQTLFSGASIYDVDHDGTRQIIVSGDKDVDPGQPAASPDLIYHLGAMTFSVERAIVALGQFTAGLDPRSWWLDFQRIRDSVGPFTVRVVNGNRAGQQRVTSASITLNGVELISATELTSAKEFVTATVPDLPTENVLRANINGTSGATILVIISDSTVRH